MITAERIRAQVAAGVSAERVASVLGLATGAAAAVFVYQLAEFIAARWNPFA